MWDTFAPLALTPLWHVNENPGYAYSWNPDRFGEGTSPGVGRASGVAENPVTPAAAVTGPSA